MNPKEISYSIKKWLLILGLGLVLGLIGGYIGVQLQIPMYQATAKFLVASSQRSNIVDLISLIDQPSIETYIELIKTKPIFDAASAKLGVIIDPENVSVLQVANNQIVHVTVKDTDSSRAAVISNTLVQILIDQINSAETERFSSYEIALNSQIENAKNQINSLQLQIQQTNEASNQDQLTKINGQIAQLQAEITTLEQDIAQFPLKITLSSTQRASLAEKETRLEQTKSLLNIYQQIQTNLIYIGKPAQVSTYPEDTRITSMQPMLILYQQLYLNLMKYLQDLQLTRFQNTAVVTQVENAVPPIEPIGPKPILLMILAGTAGIILGFGVILLLGYFDNTIKFSDDAEELLGISVLGTIPIYRQLTKSSNIVSHPADRATQAFLRLGVVLKLAHKEKNIQTLMVTSSGSTEGKTTIAINLAAAIAQQGKRVMLIDANFNHPTIHSLLGLNNDKGFAEIIQGKKNITPQLYSNGDKNSFLVLPSGNSTQFNELYLVEKVSQGLNELLKHADLLIFDAPSTSKADALMLATQVDGVLFLIRSGRTKIVSAVNAFQHLKQQGVQLLGIVINGSSEIH
jgi:succinoglycan biosynthesis transport protein ExoP